VGHGVATHAEARLPHELPRRGAPPGCPAPRSRRWSRGPARRHRAPRDGGPRRDHRPPRPRRPPSRACPGVTRPGSPRSAGRTWGHPGASPSPATSSTARPSRRRRIEDGIALLAEDPEAQRAFTAMNLAMAARRAPAIPRGLRARPRWPAHLATVSARLRADEPPGHRRAHARRARPSTFCSSPPAAARPRRTSASRRSPCSASPRHPGPRAGGVSVLMRYTLRLLTLDQLGRAATLVCALELACAAPRPRCGASGPSRSASGSARARRPTDMGEKGDGRRRHRPRAHADLPGRQRSPRPSRSRPAPGAASASSRGSFRSRPTPTTHPPDLVCTSRARGDRACPFTGNGALPIVAVDEPLYRGSRASSSPPSTSSRTSPGSVAVRGAPRTRRPLRRDGFYGPPRPSGVGTRPDGGPCRRI
jgi:hypothetical protein